MSESFDGAAIFYPLWRRKFFILGVGLLVAVATYLYFSGRPKVYEASTKIYLGGSGQVESLITGTPAQVGGSERLLTNAIEFINSAGLREAVDARLVKQHDLVAARGGVVASSSTGSDFITIATTASVPGAAANLANVYASVYLSQSNATRRQQIGAVLRSTRRQLGAAEARVRADERRSSARGSRGASSSDEAQVQLLLERVNTLESQLTAGGTGDQQVSPAVPEPTPVSPKPRQNAIFGLIVGLLLAAIVAYVLSRFDRPVESLAELETVFKAPVIAALPSVRKPLFSSGPGEVAVAVQLREPLRRLRTILQMSGARGEVQARAARTVLFVSPGNGDGKSSLVASLALTQREAGQRVVIVECDLRRPTLARMLGLDDRRGLVDVLAGELALEDALQQFGAPVLSAPVDPREGQGATATVLKRSQQAGSLALLAGGRTADDPLRLLAGDALVSLAGSLAEEFDCVLVDAPPPLLASEALPLLAAVDAIVVVTRLEHTREGTARRLNDFLAGVRTAPLVGVTATDVATRGLRAFGLPTPYNEPGV